MMMELCKWGVTTLIGLQTALFFLRNAAIGRMNASGELPPGQHLPLGMYLVGTGILSVVAAIFVGITIVTSNHYRHYHGLLKANNESGLAVPEIKNSGRILVFILYFMFPLLDILIRVYIQSIQISLK